MADNLDDTIRKNASGPAKASADAGNIKQHSLHEQIEADRYLTSKRAANKPGRGLRFSKLVPPGTE